jgi:hypothetical protein
MAVGFPAKTNFATGEVLTATNMNDITGTLNLLQQDLYPAGRNKIINGDFNINQRNFTSVTANGTYTFDRYQTTLGGTTGTATYTPQTFTAGTAPVTGYEGKNYLQLITASYSNADSWAGIAQAIESVRTFAGQTVTFSFWAKAATGTPKLGIRVMQFFGTGGSPSSPVFKYATVAAISTSWARYSVTVTLDSISGKTLGTLGDDRVTITLVGSAGSSTFEGSFGSMLQNNTFQIWGWQAENGSTASPFQTASGSIQGELALCQRYYWRANYDAQAAYGIFAQGSAGSATAAVMNVSFPVQMRVKPTAIDYPTVATNFQLIDGASGGANMVTLTFDGAQTTSMWGLINATTASGLTTYRPYVIRGNNTTGAYLGWSAEL